MIMVAHQAVSMNNRAITIESRFEIAKKLFAIRLAFVNLFLLVAARGLMIKCAGIFDAQCRAI